MFRSSAVAILGLSLAAIPAFASNADGEDPILTVVAVSAPAEAADADLRAFAKQLDTRVAASRPAILPLLYASYAGMQAYDAYSTTRGVATGARERNPLMLGVVGSPAKVWAVKAATTALPILLAERLWHRNRVAAIVQMVVLNSVSAVIVANNTRVLNRQ